MYLLQAHAPILKESLGKEENRDSPISQETKQ